MAVRCSLNVSLTPELEKFVQDRVSSGRYQTASEVIREGLRLLGQQEQERAAVLSTLKTKLARAADQAQRGEEVDGEQYLADLISKLDKKKRQSGAA